MRLKTSCQIGFFLVFCVSLSTQELQARQVKKPFSFHNATENIPKPNKKDKNKYEDKRQFADEEHTLEDINSVKDKIAKSMSERGTDWYPETYGADLSLMENTHPHKRFRKGEPTHTHSCHSVRSVPSQLRSSDYMYLTINNFYTKYTEAYGIPIVGSKNVTAEGLKRACYVVRILLSSRWDLRYAFYKFYGRIVLIGDGEQQTTLPEYSTWDSSMWDSRVRGLGPTVHTPVVSAGDDNQRCKAGDRYFDQGILEHELAHGVEMLAARHMVPAFLKRIKQLHIKNVVDGNKWQGKYAAENKLEYWAVGTQFFLNQFRGTSYHNIGVRDKDSLQQYDSDLYNLLVEVYPCANRADNMIHRCQWKECTLNSFELRYGESTKAMSKCDIIRSSYSKDSAEACASFTCYHRGNVFNYRGSTCHALKCKSTAFGDMELTQAEGHYNIYSAVKMPEMDLAAESSHRVKTLCAIGPTSDYRCNIEPYNRKACGEGFATRRSKCNKIGCCWDSDKSQCYYGSQECADRHILCPDYENQGECERNPYFMYMNCGMSCGICHKIDKMNLAAFENKCQDKTFYCQSWKNSGECSRNPGYMNTNCPLSCGKCKL